MKFFSNKKWFYYLRIIALIFVVIALFSLFMRTNKEGMKDSKKNKNKDLPGPEPIDPLSKKKFNDPSMKYPFYTHDKPKPKDTPQMKTSTKEKSGEKMNKIDSPEMGVSVQPTTSVSSNVSVDRSIPSASYNQYATSSKSNTLRSFPYQPVSQTPLNSYEFNRENGNVLDVFDMNGNVTVYSSTPAITRTNVVV